METVSQEKLRFEEHIPHERQGTYFTIPFAVKEGIESIRISYRYKRHAGTVSRQGGLTIHSRQEINIIDIGLIGPDGTQVGASGSDKSEFKISETEATPGYHPCRIAAGEWEILVGAYKVVPEGVTVSYEVHFTYKQRRLLKGDLHTHTVASDGVHTAEELIWKALRHGLDFVAITDHNQMISAEALPHVPGVTLIPGIEWTHFQGHANFLGVDRPFDGCFATNTLEETRLRFDTARQRGALITINHPYEGGCGFSFDLNSLPFDCLEIWNGPMRESNLRAVGLWQSLLAAGKKIPISGGSDYHRDNPFIILGGPTTCVYSLSTGASDILQAIRQGHAFLVFAPNGPSLEMTAGEAIMGDSVRWSEVNELQFEVGGLMAGDVVRMVTARDSQAVWKAETDCSLKGTYKMEAPGFVRMEVLRSFLPGLPLLLALISNPIYFDAD